MNVPETNVSDTFRLGVCQFFGGSGSLLITGTAAYECVVAECMNLAQSQCGQCPGSFDSLSLRDYTT